MILFYFLVCIFFYYLIPLPAKMRWCRDSIAWRADYERSKIVLRAPTRLGAMASNQM